MPTLIERYEVHEQRSGLAPGTIKLRHDQYMRFEKATGIALDTHIKAEQIQEWLDTLVLRNGQADLRQDAELLHHLVLVHVQVGDEPGHHRQEPDRQDRTSEGPPWHTRPHPRSRSGTRDQEGQRRSCGAGSLWRLTAVCAAWRWPRSKLRDILWDTGQVRCPQGEGRQSSPCASPRRDAQGAAALTTKNRRYNRATAFRRGWVTVGCGPAATAASVSQRINRFYHGMDITHTAHKNRHRAGTQAHKASGGDLLVVQRFLGHANPTTSAIYAGLDDEEVQTAIMAIPVAGRKANEAPDLLR